MGLNKKLISCLYRCSDLVETFKISAQSSSEKGVIFLISLKKEYERPVLIDFIRSNLLFIKSYILKLFSNE
jgi:hypothetical protein